MVFERMQGVFTRTFSSSRNVAARAYKSVVNRQLKKVPDYQVGDKIPVGLYIPSKKSQYPAYPYGEARIFKRGDNGLFGGQVIGFGNQISEMKNKSRRTWLPNVITKRIWSDSLNKLIKMRLTTRVLKTITKEGGLDNYLTKDKAARVKELGLFGWKLKYDIIKAREQINAPLPYEIIKKDDGSEIKIFFNGDFNGEPIQLTVGKRRILMKLYPAIKETKVEDFKVISFQHEYSNKSYADIIKVCEQYNVDLSEFSLKN